MNEILLILGMFAVTFGVRYPVLSFVSRIHLPDIVIQGLKYVPPSVLTAIIVPEVLMPEGNSINISLSNAPLVASLAASLIAWRTKNLLFTIITGMSTLWLWRLLFL
jgi:branched-subunit amino acid transport protein